MRGGFYRRDYLTPWEWAVEVVKFWLAVFSFRTYKPDYAITPLCRLCARHWPDDDDHLKCPGCGRKDTLRIEQARIRARLDDDGRETFDRLAGPGGIPPFLLLGMAALAGMAAQSRGNWWKRLGLENRPVTKAEAHTAYRAAMLKAHPDHGGSREAMDKVKKAWARAEWAYEREAADG